MKRRFLWRILRGGRRASALIIALFVVVVLSLVVVAFLRVMTLERRIARSHILKTRAELAAKAGLQLVREMIHSVVGGPGFPYTNFGYATYATNLDPTLAPVLLLAVPGPDGGRAMPLVSCAEAMRLIPGGATNAAQLEECLTGAADQRDATDANRRIGAFRALSEEAPRKRFNAPWIYLTDPDGRTNARFCFFVVDESAKLNLAVHGTEADTPRVGWEQGPERIPRAIPGQPAFPEFSNVLTNKAFPGMPYSALGQAFTSRPAFEQAKHLYTLHSIPGASFIPAGRFAANGTFVAYSDAHKPRFAINDLATNPVWGATATERAQNLARIINTNLPGFQTRDVAFVAAGRSTNQIRYVERIAAAIVDYIDADTEPTLLSDGEPAGKELAPLITAIGERYNWISEAGAGSEWTNEITHTVFAQVWNPYQTNISGEMRLALETFRPIEMPGAVLEPMQEVSGTNSVVLRPNEWRVYEMGTATNTVVSSVRGSLHTANHPLLAQTASEDVTKPLHTRFKAFWGGILMDWTPNESDFFEANGPGLEKQANGGSAATRIALGGASRFSVNYPQFGYFDAAKGFRGSGDPRQNYLANYVWRHAASTNAEVRWGGRNAFDATDSRSQDYQTTWARRDWPRDNPPEGTHVGNNDPTTAPSSWDATVASNAPAFLRNGPMRTIGELGNIYDPVQLSDSGFATKAGSPQSWFAAGGGRTLRIGQPEFDYPATNSPTASERKSPAWNQDDLRALSLADIFTALPVDAEGFPASQGRINLNTASRDVLAAVFWQLGQDGDPAHADSRMTAEGAYRMADAVMAGRPYLRPGDYHRFLADLLDSENYDPPLGAPSANPAAILDAGREQLLGALQESLDYRSQVFQVVAIGEALDAQGGFAAQGILRAILAIRFEKSPGSGDITCKVTPVHIQTY